MNYRKLQGSIFLGDLPGGCVQPLPDWTALFKVLDFSGPNRKGQSCETQTAYPFAAEDTPVRRIKNEVLVLMEQQTSAICSAAFVGMTRGEAKECEERCQKIAALVDELARIEERRHNHP